MIGRNYINVEMQKAQIVDEYAIRKDKRKAYQIFLLSFILGSLLTFVQYYFVTQL